MRGTRILSRQDCREVLKRARAFAKGGGYTMVRISSWWQGELRWARNRVRLASDRRNVQVTVRRVIKRGVPAWAQTNQLDDASLEATVRAAERKSAFGAVMGRNLGFYPEPPHYKLPKMAEIWSDLTYGLDVNARGEVARSMIVPAEAEGLYAAGYLELRAATIAQFGTAFPELRSGKYAFWEQPYVRWTQAQCSMTVRDRSGTGSGWAGVSSYDWGRIDSKVLAERAVDKGIASRNPVAVEPGRYTVVLEPQAVADLLEILVRTLLAREVPETGQPSPWRLAYDEALQLWRSKLGLKVADERVTITHDPADPALGIVMHPVQRPGPVTWIEHGVLTALGHRFVTAITELPGWHALRGPIGYRMIGGKTPVEDMIGTTRRGLLVTRFWNIRRLDRESLLSTGLTRDGLWLIENGEITKAVKNFRFTESPVFMLNKIEQLGEPVPVFRPTKNEGGLLTPAVVPPLKVRDFSFTSLVSAV